MTSGRCACGSELLTTTEDWSTPKCIDCWEALGEPRSEPDWTRVALTTPRPAPSSEVTPEDRERARAWWSAHAASSRRPTRPQAGELGERVRVRSEGYVSQSIIFWLA